jgi:hypothetical protein
VKPPLDTFVPVLSKPLMIGATGGRLRKAERNGNLELPGQIDHARDRQVVTREIGTVSGEVVVQVLRDVQDALAALQRVRRRELIAPRETFVELDQQGLVFGRRARPPEVDRAGGALSSRIVGLRGAAPRNHRPVDGVETVEIDARAEEAAGRSVDHLPVDEVRLDHEVAGQLTLKPDVEVLGARGREIVRVQRAERVGLLGEQNLRLCAGPRCGAQRRAADVEVVGVFSQTG